MPFFSRCLILSIACFSSPLVAYADLVQVSQNRLSDRIEQLTQELAVGSYGNAEQKAEATAEEAVAAAEKAPIFIDPKEYKALGIKSSYKTYADSDIWYLPETEKYIEQKFFPNNVRFFKLVISDTAVLTDMDDESATDDDDWYVHCSKDRITDEKICLMGKYEIMFIRSSKTGWMFSVSKETNKLNPMQYQYIRIDKLPALKSRTFFKGQAPNIIEQMKKGTTAYTRFYEWSGDYEETIPLKGFSIAYNTLNIMYSKL